MNRREFLKSTATVAPALFLTTFAAPARAIAPPVVVAIAGVFFSVAFRRYVVGPLMSTLARWFPRLFATELRKYLMAVAVAFGMSHAKAALTAEQAENSGAQDLARDGEERVTDLAILNNNDEPLELTRLNLLLVDVSTRSVELRSSTNWGLVVPPGASMNRQIVCRRFPNQGLKQWYLADGRRTLAVSKPFMVVG